jgi:hypothetical protein
MFTVRVWSGCVLCACVCLHEYTYMSMHTHVSTYTALKNNGDDLGQVAQLMLPLQEPKNSGINLHAPNPVRFKLAAAAECHLSLPVLGHVEMRLPFKRAVHRYYFPSASRPAGQKGISTLRIDHALDRNLCVLHEQIKVQQAQTSGGRTGDTVATCACTQPVKY